MPLRTFKESGLTFRFPKNWVVIKYDGHRFYKSLSGQGFKGVDFLAINNLEKLVLIEVKNFNNRFEKDGVHPTQTFLDNQDFYFDAFVHKFQDTYHLIKLIHKFYLRKWWFRKMAIPFSKYAPIAYWIKFDWGKWLLIYHFMKKEKVEQIVCLEFDKAFQLDLKIVDKDLHNFTTSRKIKLPGNIRILDQSAILAAKY